MEAEVSILVVTISSKTPAGLKRESTSGRDMHRSVRASPLMGLPWDLSLKMGREGKHRVNCSGNQHPSNLTSSELNTDTSGIPT